MEIAVCDPDPVLSQMLSGGMLLSGLAEDGDSASSALGWASAEVGEDPSGDGVAVEVWSRAIVDGKPIRASRRSAEWCLAAVDQCWTQKVVNIRPAERAEAARAYDHARAVYRKLIEESLQP